MHCRKRGVLNEENIAWLEQVFRENVGKGKEEFTLDEFKKIVPSKNVTPLSPRDFLLIFLFAGIFCWKGIQNIWQGWQRNCLAGGVYRDNAPVLRPGRWRENIFSFQSLWLKWWVDYSLNLKIVFFPLCFQEKIYSGQKWSSQLNKLFYMCDISLELESSEKSLFHANQFGQFASTEKSVGWL